jgi:hypothetical protein
MISNIGIDLLKEALIEQQPELLSIRYANHVYQFLTNDNAERKVIINIQPGDPDTIELAHFQIMWLQSLGIKQANILVTIANPIIDASFPITNVQFHKIKNNHNVVVDNTITIESCTLDKLTISNKGQELTSLLKEAGLLQEDLEKNLLTINISYSWFLQNKEKLSGILGQGLVDSINDMHALGNILGFIILQVLLLSKYENDCKVAEFITSKLEALKEKNIDAYSFACYLYSKLSNLDKPRPTPLIFIKQSADQTAREFEEFFNQHFRGQQDIAYSKIFIDTVLNRAVVNFKLSEDFHNKYPDVQVISSGIYPEPIVSATYKGVTVKALSRKVNNLDDQIKHNHCLPDERRKLTVDFALTELFKANPDNTKMLDIFQNDGLQIIENFMLTPNTVIISGAPNTFNTVLLRNFVGKHKIDAKLIKAFSAKYGDHLQILFTGTTDPNKFNLTGAGYNECSDKFAALLI